MQNTVQVGSEAAGARSCPPETTNSTPGGKRREAKVAAAATRGPHESQTTRLTAGTWIPLGAAVTAVILFGGLIVTVVSFGISTQSQIAHMQETTQSSIDRMQERFSDRLARIETTIAEQVTKSDMELFKSELQRFNPGVIVPGIERPPTFSDPTERK